MSKRIGIVDLWKFIACIIIITHHTYKILPSNYHRSLVDLRVFVEFFFIITGYFTMLHFDKNDNTEQMAKSSIKYTIKKFSIFLPYVVIITIVQYSVEYYVCYGKISSIGSLSYFLDVLFDSLLMGRYVEHVIPIWFLSAMFLVFPLFCMMCQMKDKYLLYIFSFLLTTYWCKCTNVESYNFFPLSLIRAFVFLMLGAFVYGVASYIKDFDFRKCWKIIFTIIEEFCMVFAIILLIKNEGYKSFVIFCFSIALIFIFSEQTYTSKLNSRVFAWLGEISMVMYIAHWTIIYIIQIYLPYLEIYQKLILLYLVTFLFSLLFYMIIEKIIKQIDMKKVFLRDAD